MKKSGFVSFMVALFMATLIEKRVDAEQIDHGPASWDVDARECDQRS